MADLSRRDVLRAVGAGGATLALGCGGDGETPRTSRRRSSSRSATRCSSRSGRRGTTAGVAGRTGDGSVVTHAVPLVGIGIGGLGTLALRGLPPAYRERHVETRTLGKVRTLFQAMPVRAIYDDHEVIDDRDAMRAAAGLTVWGLGAGGVRFYEETFTAADLTPRP